MAGKKQVLRNESVIVAGCVARDASRVARDAGRGTSGASILRHRETRADPILFALAILADVRVTHGRQITGGSTRRRSREVPAIHDDLGALVRDERRHGRDLLERKALGSRKVMLTPIHPRQHLEKMEALATLNFLVQLLT